jgi:hypothetical protein
MSNQEVTVGQYGEKFMLNCLRIALPDKEALRDEAREMFSRPAKLRDAMNDVDRNDLDLLDFTDIEQLSQR